MGVCMPEEETVSTVEFPLGEFKDSEKLVAILVSGGLTEAVAKTKVGLYMDAVEKLLAAGHTPETPASAFWVPGRIEVVGKHTDYAGGRSLLGAVSRGFCVISVAREDSKCRIFSTIGDEAKEVLIEMDGKADPEKLENWCVYPVTTINRLVNNFKIDKGVDFAIGNDIPGASGMSTSSAMICAVFMVMDVRCGLASNELFKTHLPDKQALYGYLGCCENGQNCGELIGTKGVGTFGGSEDHTAIMSCTANKLNMFSYCPTAYESTFSFPDDLVFVIASSGAVAEKTGDKLEDYNNAAFLAFAAAEAYVDAVDAEELRHEPPKPPASLKDCIEHAKKQHTEPPGHDSLRQFIHDKIASVDDGTKYGLKYGDKPFPKGLLADRFDQFYIESEEIVAQVGQAFEKKDYDTLKTLIAKSQELTDTHLKNLVPETRELPAMAINNGALAASAFGAGFGGSCWAVIKEDEAVKFSDAWKKEYLEKFDAPHIQEKALFFSMHPGPGAFRLGNCKGQYSMDKDSC